MSKLLSVVVVLMTIKTTLVQGSEFICLNTPDNHQIQIPANEDIVIGSVCDTEKYFLVSSEGVVDPTLSIGELNKNELWLVEKELLNKGTYAGYRPYDVDLTISQVEDLHFILKTMAQNSILSLFGYKTELERAKARLDAVHPLKSIEAIYHSEELFGYLETLAIRQGLVWTRFFTGYATKLQEELDVGNLTHEHLELFAASLGLDIDKLTPIVQKNAWERFFQYILSTKN